MLLTILGAGLVVAAAIAQVQGSDFIFWRDELETVLATRTVASGLRLYTETYAQEGPLHFLIGAPLAAMGFTPVGYRLVIAVLQWGAIAAILLSRPRLEPSARLLLLVALLVWLIYFLPEIDGHMFLYETFGGLIFATALSIYTLPALRTVDGPGQGASFAGGFLLAAAPFFAFPFGPAAILLFVVGLRASTVRPAVAGAVLAVVLSVGLLIAFGSIPGYIAYHFYANLVVYAKIFPDNNPLIAWSHPNKRELFYAAIAVFTLGTAAIVLLSERVGRWRVALVVLAVVSLFLRGPSHNSLAGYYSVAALFVFYAPMLRRAAGLGLPLVVPAALAGIVMMLHFNLWHRDRLELLRIPRTSPFIDYVRANTGPDDRILSYPFAPEDYVYSDRLPGSLNYFYVPVEAIYYQHPILGIYNSPCDDIEKNRPKVIRIEHAVVWDKYPWDDYQGCINETVEKLYVRTDLPDVYRLADGG